MCSYLYDGVNRTSLLTESTIDAFGHVNIVSSGSPTSISTLLSFNGNGLLSAQKLSEIRKIVKYSKR